MNVIYGSPFEAPHRLSAEQLVRRAQAIIPELRERRHLADELRRLPDETGRTLRESGLARLIQPARFGGAEAAIETIIDVLIPISNGCASTAWCLAQYIMHNYMIARWPLAAQQRVWERPDNLVSGILIPRLGRARPVSGGHAISGSWPFVSGVQGSDWCLLTAMAELPDGPNEECCFLVPIADVTIVDTWYPIGLQGSGSQTVAAEELFVPDVMSLPIRALKRPATSEGGTLLAPVFRLPVYMTFGVLLASSLIGMAESLFEAFLTQSRTRRALMSDEETASFATQHVRVGEVSASLQAAEALLRADSREMMEAAKIGGEISDLDRSSYRCNGAFAGRLAIEAAQTIWDLIGARGAYEDNAIAQIFQDMLVASRHVTMNWEVNATEHGRARLRLGLSNPLL